jgi:hypothetical protein
LTFVFFQSYPRSFAGLMACYGAGLPFYGWQILGDLIYSTVWFSVHKYFSTKFAKFAVEKVGPKSVFEASIQEQEEAHLLTSSPISATPSV